MSAATIGNRAARHLFLDRHALAEQPAGPARGEDLLALIHRLGFVQLDSINTLARAHDMILYARRPTYRAKNLKRLYETDRALFEHWTHDAAVIPMDFYPHWQLRFRRDADLLKHRWRNWRRDGFEQQFQTVLQHVREYGSVCSSDVGKDEKKGSGGWWDWHPSKTALEFLWRSGALTVVGRDGFQKRYDLTERVIDSAPDVPDPEETVDWLCGGAIDRLGFATSGEIAAFWDTVTSREAKEWCARELARGALIPVDIEAHDGKLRSCFARPDVMDMAGQAPKPPGRIRVLSPFDPALRNRDRTQRLFGFHYRIEVFVPAEKRKFGYYVFPLLEGDRLIGRIDMKAQRECGRLSVTALWPERGVRWSAARTGRLMAELERVCRFTGLGDIQMQDGWLRNPQ
ncbi:winged helix-turn-helix domain-containing protein [Sedimentitalea todarodis]|uniref:Crosslink repair DNA glycosylase YcaQ family protein n=1 Tax=Sedimentitalea todarodis TaxID=1631240 RepID=A0ABU3VHU3_9RHOB|nr:crosslink repair DNA glycosylase YcaQ family protein [Sedimentitalea todarodis]MDU9005730.1 crosslink repair DNA glycosylase YcaQ family protein [Sedimentitalea todarodis]